MRAIGLPVVSHWKVTVEPTVAVVGNGVVMKPGRPVKKDAKTLQIHRNISNKLGSKCCLQLS